VSKLEAALGALLVLVIAAHFSIQRDPTRRNIDVLPDMVLSTAWESQSACPLFEDGKTMQMPPEGTIARGFLPLHARGILLDVTTPYKELSPEQVRAWDTLESPEPDEKTLERGRGVFANFCVVCHGAGGAGDGTVTKLGVPPPTPLTGQGAKEKSDGRLFRIITAGEGNMPPYASQVSREDRWKVIRYIRSLQTP